MSDRVALLHLARRIGIEPRFTDALGQTREASDETLLALAVAFGLGAEPASALGELDARERGLPLGLGPAHLVHAEDARPQLVLRVPAPIREIVWTCRLEDGREHAGRLKPDSGGNGGSLVLPLP